MRNKFFLLLTILLLANVSFGQSKQKDIKELFELMHSEQLVDKMFDNIVVSIRKNIETQIQGESNSTQFEDYMSFVLAESKEMSKKVINTDMIELYDKYFTQEDIKEMIRFYKTSSGQKMINVLPDLQKDMMDIMFKKYMPEFQKKIGERLDEMKKKE